MTPATFKERVEAMASASPADAAMIRRDLRAEFATEMRASNVTGAALSEALGITAPAVSNYIVGKTRFAYKNLKYVLWMLDGGDFEGRARAFILATDEDREKMQRDVAGELFAALREEGVTQRTLSKALGEDYHYTNNLVNGYRPFTHKILERVIWLLDGDKKEEGQL